MENDGISTVPEEMDGTGAEENIIEIGHRRMHSKPNLFEYNPETKQ